MHSMTSGRGGTATPTRRPVQRGLAVAVLIVGLALCLMSMGSRDSSASTIGGVATITNPQTNAPLASGGSAEEFTVGLPSQAACSGDSATQHYEVWSYVVVQPANVSSLAAQIEALNMLTGEGTAWYPLYSDGLASGWGPANTAAHTGQIIGIPLDFSWEGLNNLFTSNGSPPLVPSAVGSTATYDGGILCTKPASGTGSPTVSDFWNFQITFTSVTKGTGAGQDPNGFVWSTTPGMPSTGPGGTTTTTNPGSTTTSTTVAATTTTTAPACGSCGGVTTTTTTVAGGAGGSGGGGGSGGTGAGTGTGTGTGGGTPSADPSSQLAATGRSIRPELDVGVSLIGGGLFFLVAIPRRRQSRLLNR